MPDTLEIPESIEFYRSTPESWYRPGRSIAEFHSSPIKTRVLLGGRGSGKTYAIAVEATGHGFHNAGARIYILRKTQDSNEDTTLETFEQVFGEMGTGYTDTDTSLFKKVEGGKQFRIPSRKAIELFNRWQAKNPKATKAQTKLWLDSVGNRYCSWIYFAGVPEARYRASRFRGYECSMLIFVEADQLDRADLDLGLACLRWKGADPATCDAKGFIRDTCVILDSNPPSPRHWIAELEKETENDPKFKFWHIATHENRHNLPDDYIESLERTYKKNPAMFKRMLLGQYAEAFDGTPVLFNFNIVSHPSKTLDWPKGAYLVRGWDFGTTHANVWSAYWCREFEVANKRVKFEYWWDLHEAFAEQSDTERQCKRVVEETEAVFPFWNDRTVCSGVLDFCDIAGNAKTATGSSVRVLRSFGIFPGFRAMGLQESIAIYNRLLEKTDPDGKPIYRIDSEACPMLFVASQGGYRYPSAGEPGFGGDEPGKGPQFGNFDHIADCARYAKVNCMRLLREEVLSPAARTGVLAVKTALNPMKSY